MLTCAVLISFSSGGKLLVTCPIRVIATRGKLHYTCTIRRLKGEGSRNATASAWEKVWAERPLDEL